MTKHTLRYAATVATLFAGAAVVAGVQVVPPLAGASAHGAGARVTGKKTSGKHGTADGSHTTKSTGPTVKVAKVAGVGTVLVNSGGQTLYVFSKDHHGRSQCSGACATSWPPLVVSRKPVAGAGVGKSLLGTVRRAGHKLQVTYGHWPLYTFAGDTSPGQAHGQGITGFGGKWSTIGAAGSAFTSNAGSGSSGTTGSTGGSTGGSSGTGSSGSNGGYGYGY